MVELGVVLGGMELSVEPELAQPPNNATRESTAGITITRIIHTSTVGETTDCTRA